MLQVAIGRIAQMLLLVITIRVATSLLKPDEMARVFLISSAIAFFASVLLNPVGMFMNRRLNAWNDTGKVKIYYKYFWRYLLTVALVASASTMALVSFNLLEFHTNVLWLSSLISASLLISTLNQVMIPGLNLLGYRTLFINLTLATTATSLVLAIIIVVILQPSAEYWIVGLLLGQLFIGLISARIFYLKINSNAGAHSKQYTLTSHHYHLIWGFSWPIVIGAFLVWTQTQSYRFIMESSLGLAEVGLFAAGYAISAGIIAGVESIFTAYFQPVFYKHVSGEDTSQQGQAWRNYASSILPSLILVSFCIVAAAPELTKLMLGSTYSESSKFIVWGVIAEMARVANNVYGLVAHAKMKTSILVLPNAIGVLVSIALIILLMPLFGSVGVGIALASASTTTFISTYIATRKQLVTSLPNKVFIQCLMTGIAFIVIALVIRKTIGEEGLFSALILLTLLAVVFLPIQYWTLQPILNEKIKLNE